MGFYIFLPGAPPHSIYDPHGAFCRMHCWESKLACLRCEKVWAFKRKVQCCLFSGPWVCSDKWGAGKDSSFTWLHSNGIAGAGWAWDSNLGVSRNQFNSIHISARFSTFLHIHIILRWANKIRCWLPIAGNTKISPGEPCWKRIAGGDRWWLTFCGSSRGRRFCRGVVFYVSSCDAAVLMIHWWFYLIFLPITIGVYMNLV